MSFGRIALPGEDLDHGGRGTCSPPASCRANGTGAFGGKSDTDGARQTWGENGWQDSDRVLFASGDPICRPLVVPARLFEESNGTY